jgi:hypothetical protein
MENTRKGDGRGREGVGANFISYIESNFLGFAKGKKEDDGVCMSLLAGAGTKFEIPGNGRSRSLSSPMLSLFLFRL